MDNKKKILIIEDESILGGLLSQKLTEEGYTVFWEVDGEAGLRKMREILPDMVLLDIVMPKKDGYEVLEEMHADSTLKDIPVIVISNSGQPVEIKRILAFGVKDYVIKAQFSPAEVLDKVRKYLHIAERTEPENKNFSGIKILMVEDDSFLLSIIAMYLKKEGCQIAVATDGDHVFSLLEKDIPDLILLDIVLPGTSGLTVLKTLKADKRYKNIPVIMFSNIGQEHEIEYSKKLGADYFLVKANFTPREVLEKIQEVLQKKRRI